MITFILG